MATTTIKYGDDLFYSEEDYDEVVRAVADGRAVDVYRACATCDQRVLHHLRITFFGDPDWVSVEL